MAKLYFRRSGTTYSSLLAGSSSGLLVRTGGVTLGASATTGSVPVGGNYLQYSKGGSTYNVFLNNNYTTWTALATGQPAGQTIEYMVYGNGVFVGLTQVGAIYTSTTGLSGSWTFRTNVGSDSGGFLRFFGGRFYAQSYNAGDPSTIGDVQTSLDGITWSWIYNIGQYPAFLSYDGTTVLIGNTSTSVQKSTNNGSSWTTVTVPSGFGSYGFKFAGAYFYFNGAVLYKSTDLSSFTTTTAPPISPQNTFFHNHFYSNEKVLIWTNAAATVYYYSSDLVNWTTGTWPNSYTAGRYLWCVNGLTYMSNGTSTTNCYVTVDGISWTLVSMTGGITPYGTSYFSIYAGTNINLKSKYQEGIIGNFSGVNKFILSVSGGSGLEFRISDGI
jgi:hypothetical protein